MAAVERAGKAVVANARLTLAAPRLTAIAHAAEVSIFTWRPIGERRAAPVLARLARAAGDPSADVGHALASCATFTRGARAAPAAAVFAARSTFTAPKAAADSTTLASIGTAIPGRYAGRIANAGVEEMPTAFSTARVAPRVPPAALPRVPARRLPAPPGGRRPAPPGLVTAEGG
ncbi:MAG: hypothetical protein ACRERE_12030 [Candidatus Entotheonellia bacterium]